jgi:hypothetical protein
MRIFNQFDVDRSGGIDPDELRAAIDKMAQASGQVGLSPARPPAIVCCLEPLGRTVLSVHPPEFLPADAQRVGALPPVLTGRVSSLFPY